MCKPLDSTRAKFKTNRGGEDNPDEPHYRTGKKSAQEEENLDSFIEKRMTIFHLF